jgi:2-polyprenyl-6-methoxyphenol hydroxylase-like FAD-dependent oxidoreductase
MRDQRGLTGGIPVLIAGGGPVGLALAIELGRSGIACTLVEKRDGSLTVPKMSGLSIRSMEFNRRWGIAEEVKLLGWPQPYPNDFVYCTTMTGYELTRRRVPSYEKSKLPFTPEPSAGCAQIYYDPVLLKHAQSLPHVTIRHLTSLVDFQQDEYGVSATVFDHAGGRREELRADYLVGCDGAEGAVAPHLGVTYEGLGTVSHSVNIFFRSAELMRLHAMGWARFFRFTDEGGSWGEIVGIDGEETWRLSVFNALPGYDADAYMRRLAGRDFDCEILSVMDWERRERVVDRYRDRRVFLAGDSAHQTSPTGGLGLHTGLADAVDLGWKLRAVIEGWGENALLDSYQIERKPVAIKNLQASTEEFNIVVALPGDPLIEEDSPVGAAARARFVDTFERTGYGHSSLFTENLRLGYCYEPSPICVADGSPGVSLENPKFVATARPGTRAPHAWLDDGRSILDLFGDGFVLLRFGPTLPSVDPLIEAAASRHVPMEIVDLSDAAIASLYERPLVLVRPDGHVAWRGTTLPEDPGALIDRVRGAL